MISGAVLADQYRQSFNRLSIDHIMTGNFYLYLSIFSIFSIFHFFYSPNCDANLGLKNCVTSRLATHLRVAGFCDVFARAVQRVTPRTERYHCRSCSAAATFTTVGRRGAIVSTNDSKGGSASQVQEPDTLRSALCRRGADGVLGLHAAVAQLQATKFRLRSCEKKIFDHSDLSAAPAGVLR